MMQPTKPLLGHRTLLSVAVVYTIAISVAALVPVPELPKVDQVFLDKWAHLIIHALLFVVWAISWEALQSSILSRKSMLFLLLGSIGYGIIIELLQEICTTYRYADMLDVVANIVGSIIGLGIFLLRRRLISN